MSFAESFSFQSARPFVHPEPFSALRKRPGYTPETILSWAAENYIQGTTRHTVLKASLGFEVRHEQLRVSPPSMNMGGGRAAGGEAKGRSFETGLRLGHDRGCPVYNPAFPAQVLSRHWEKVAT